MASPTRIVALSANFIALMVVSNVLEEYLYARLPGFDFFETTATVELLLFAVASWCSRDAAAPRKAPLPLYGAMGVSMALGQTLGKLANKYVNFTVSTIFKCSKVAPTMVVSSLFLGRRYDAYEVAAVVVMGAAAACFALGAAAVDVSFSSRGVACNVLFLFFAAAQVGLQDAALRDYGASVVEAMFHANAFGLASVGGVALVDGELGRALLYFAARPWAVALLVARTLTFYLAVRSYTVLIKEAGGVAAVTVGIVRKILTIVCSLIVYPKKFSMSYVYGGCLFAAALALEARNGLRKHRKAAPVSKV